MLAFALLMYLRFLKVSPPRIPSSPHTPILLVSFNARARLSRYTHPNAFRPLAGGNSPHWENLFCKYIPASALILPGLTRSIVRLLKGDGTFAVRAHHAVPTTPPSDPSWIVTPCDWQLSNCSLRRHLPSSSRECHTGFCLSVPDSLDRCR